MKKIAFLFPGQGSQKVGMGQDLYQSLDYAREIFETADAVSELPVTQLCFQGPMESLTQTVNLQPAITAVNLALLAAVQRQIITPSICAGHSLGEYSALCAAGVISVRDCLRLVLKRGQLMDREATRNQGAMSAIVGLGFDQVAEIVSRTAQSGVVAVANHNSADQIVITGAPEPVQAAGEKATALGARAIALKVSGAWHSPLIKGAEAEFRAFLDDVEFSDPLCPVVHNVTADTEQNGQKIKQLMARQLCSPVRWYDTMLKMAQEKIEVYAEIGPGRVLTGLLKKSLPADHRARIYNIADLKSLQKFLETEA